MNKITTHQNDYRIRKLFIRRQPEVNINQVVESGIQISWANVCEATVSLKVILAYDTVGVGG